MAATSVAGDYVAEEAVMRHVSGGWGDACFSPSAVAVPAVVRFARASPDRALRT